MSSTDLATRCPACKTVFRVVPDQLKVSAGWVRCGRCAEVFNAHEALVEAAVVTTQAMPDELRNGPSTFAPTQTAANSPGEAPTSRAAPGSSPARAPGTTFSFDSPTGERPRFSPATPGTAQGLHADSQTGERAAAFDPADTIEAAAGWAFGPLTPPIDPGQTAPESREALGATPVRNSTPFGSGSTASSAADETDGLITRRAPRKGLDPLDHSTAIDSMGRQSLQVPEGSEALMARPTPTAPPNSRHMAPPPAQEHPAGPSVEVPADPPSESPSTLLEAPEPSQTPEFAEQPVSPIKSIPRDTESEPALAPLTLDPVAPMPSFVRRANRAARWHSTPVRMALLAGCGLAAAMLAVQAGYQYRDDLAARWPASKPTLLSACEALGCEIQAARSIDGLVIDSIDLSRLDKTADLHGLTVAVRNQRRYEVALPALELSLTDPQGRLIARKVLLPQDLGVSNKAAVAAQGEVTLQGTLSLALGPVAGYTIVAFYP